MTILEAMDDLKLFGRWFRGKSWSPWRVCLAALFALQMTDEQLELYRQCTGRKKPPKKAVREGWIIKGRRAGGTLIAALIAVYLGAFRDYRNHLAPGERALVQVIAADRRQARVCFRYVRAFLSEVPMLKAIIVAERKESVDLNNGVTIEIHTASYRTTRGYTCAAVIADECAFWSSDTDGANPDVEIIKALRPSLATLPGALLLGLSSPYSRRGVLWEQYKKHHGVDGSPVLTWQAPSEVMNPTLDAKVIAAAYEEDPDGARAEWGGEFRSDLESFVSREAVDAVVIPERRELPPVDGLSYFGFTDPAGGSGGDSFTLAIAHVDRGGDVVLDCIRERRPPFSPDAVCKEFAELLKSYGVSSVRSDYYAGGWPVERFATHGIRCEQASRPKSEIYLATLPLLNAGKVELLDLPKLIAQLCALERRTARSGKDSVDHPPRGHDDVINSAAGALLLAHESARTCLVVVPPDMSSPSYWTSLGT